MNGPLDRFVHSSPPANSSEEKPAQPSRTGIDASNTGTTVETNPGTDCQTRNELNPNLLRNHRCDKKGFDETAVSPKNNEPEEWKVGSKPRKHPKERRLTWRDIVGITRDDPWHSKYASMQNLLDYLKLRKTASLRSVQNFGLCCLAPFCRSLGLNPDELTRLPREKIEKLINTFCDSLMERSRKRGRSAGYANVTMACLKTFFKVNGFTRENALELKGYHQPPRVRNTPEYIPTMKEALTMAERAGSKRDTAIIFTLISSGLRNSALRAIKIGDILTELKLGSTELLVSIDASWNDRIPGACKNCIPYYTFICKKASEAIQAMLKERERIFGSYDPEEPLFITYYNQIPREKRRKTPLTARQLQIIVQKAAEAANIEEAKSVHPHALRKVFESVLRSPLDDGDRMDTKDQEFLMGHILGGSQDNYYDRSKVERIRQLYAKLVFEDRAPSEIRSIRKMASLLGLDVPGLIAVKEKELSRQVSLGEEQELLEKEIRAAFARAKNEGPATQRKRIIVPVCELKSYIEQGWDYVPPPLPDGNVVVEQGNPF